MSDFYCTKNKVICILIWFIPCIYTEINIVCPNDYNVDTNENWCCTRFIGSSTNYCYDNTDGKTPVCSNSNYKLIYVNGVGFSTGTKMGCVLKTFCPTNFNYDPLTLAPINWCRILRPSDSTVSQQVPGLEMPSCYPNTYQYTAQPLIPSTQYNYYGCALMTICPYGFYPTNPTLNPSGICRVYDPSTQRNYYFPPGVTYSCPLGSTIQSKVHTDDKTYYGCVECPTGQSFDTSTYQCTLCPPGTYKTALGYTLVATGCISCRAGSYGILTGAASSQACTTCAQGQYSTTLRGSSANVCQQCQAGTFSTASYPSNCTTCPNGQFTDTMGSTKCYLCDIGTYTDLSTPKSACSPCPPGSFTNTQGSTACSLCSNGTYQDTPQQASCKPCEEGTYQNAKGQVACQRCKTCPNNQYITHLCPASSSTDTSNCTPCTICPDQYYASPACQKGSNTQLGSNSVCALCTPCDNPNEYISAGCVSNYPKVCSPCSVCASETLRQCSVWTDSLCEYSAQCRQNTTFTIPSWIIENTQFRCPKGQYISNITSISVECTSCPSYLIGNDGITCQPCLGYRETYWDSTGCICKAPSVQNDLGECYCDIGYEFGSAGCSLCKNNTYSANILQLDTTWWKQEKTCLPCPDGFYSHGGASACTQCPLYTYLLYNHSTLQEGMICQSCPTGYYAEDPSSSNCTACSSSCLSIGEFSVPCPTDASAFICDTCSIKPNNSYWLEKSNLTTTYECIWRCLPDYYALGGEEQPCQPCSSFQCPPGKVHQPCSLSSDMNCDLDCVNETKPLFNSEWGDTGCEWKCISGYVMQVLDYVMWVQYECVMVDSLQFWTW